MIEVKIKDPNKIDPIKWEKYTGEDVIVRTVIRKGKKELEWAYFDDKVKAEPSGNAYIIGNGPSRKDFDLNLLNGSGQVYGCNALYRDYTPDFLFSVDAKMTKEIATSGITEKVVCYAPLLEVNRNKGFNLIPRNPHYISGNAALHTAIIHGHTNVYMLGFDFREYGKGQLNNIYQDTECYGERNNDDIFNAWLQQFRKMIKQRPYVKFNVVHNNPPEYLHHLITGDHQDNANVMNYDDFIEKVLNQNV